MAKYDITYSCGHKGEITLFGKTSERERKIAWYESTGLCPDCKKIETIKLTDKLEKELDLPTIEGVSENRLIMLVVLDLRLRIITKKRYNK